MSDGSLAGTSLLLARTEREVVGLKADLMQRGASIVSVPVMHVEERHGWADAVFTDVAPAWTIVTTKGAAERLTRAIRAGLGEHRQLGAIAAVGMTTARYLEKYGLWPQLSCETHDLDALVRGLQQRGVASKSVRIIGDEDVQTFIGEAVRKTGARVETVALYRTTFQHGNLEIFRVNSRDKPALIVFPSLQTVHALAALFHEADATAWWKIPAAAIGPTTAQAAKEYGFDVVAMPEPLHTMVGLADAIETWVCARV